MFISVIETDKKNVTTIRHLTDPAVFTHVLMTFNEQMNQEEMDDMFEEFEVDDDGLVLTKSIVSIRNSDLNNSRIRKQCSQPKFPFNHYFNHYF